MSFPEVLTAMKSLPHDEKIQLLHALVDEVGGPRKTTPEEALLAKLFRQGEILNAGWQVTTDEAGMQAIQEMLTSTKGRG